LKKLVHFRDSYTPSAYEIIYFVGVFYFHPSKFNIYFNFIYLEKEAKGAEGKGSFYMNGLI